MSAPEISVVLAAQNAGSSVKDCLQSLRHQSIASAAEVILAEGSTDSTGETVRSEFPEVRLLHIAHPVGLPELTRQAMKIAQGRIVALVDPWCTFPPDWLENLRRSHHSEFDVIGGAVENGCTKGLLNWACFFADYGAFMPPASRRVTRILAGNHVSYKRELIQEYLDRMDAGFWKVFFHWELEQRGIPFLFDPELVVRYARRHTFAGFLGGYFEHGWFFAGMRCRRISVAERWLRLVTAPLLPAVLLYRRIRDVAVKGRYAGKLALSIPFLSVFVTAWASGEALGYLLGRTPGHLYR